MSSGTVGALYQEGAALLCEAGLDEATYDARALLAHVLDCRLNDVLLRQAEPLGEQETVIYRELLRLRAARMPLQYVTRSTGFCGLHLRVDDRALIPRRETELLAEAVAERLNLLLPGTEDCVVDIGCGSGALGLGLAALVPDVRVAMTDVSPEALELAAENVENLGFEGRVTLLQGPYLEPVHLAGLTEATVALVSNPPYIRADEMPELAPEVHAEPRLALVSPADDGMEAYRVLAQEARTLPRLRLLAFEVGFEQALPVARLVKGLGTVEVLLDYSQIERMVIVHVR